MVDRYPRVGCKHHRVPHTETTGVAPRSVRERDVGYGGILQEEGRDCRERFIEGTAGC